ncbi:unnamed protein product [Symbiodinium pilosum]|uniref:Uncharacterized protein n=1 Tax=Symbiodinium pilosum TaxID=2952 RepID=A0A812L732_SYMPI|nr:unnamed protein product [Symbiodinium pilosum]
MAMPAESLKGSVEQVLSHQREAVLARAVSSLQRAAAEVQKAAAHLSACEAAWLEAYEAALQSAEDEVEAGAVRRAAADLKPQPGLGLYTLRTFHDEFRGSLPAAEALGHESDAAHGQHHDEFHTAKHQLEHRWIEKTAFSAAERVLERMTERMSESIGERVGERLAERGVERLAERGTERLAQRGVERLAERGAERLAERGAERLAERGVERLAERGVERLAERGAERLAERGAELALERAGASAVRHILARTIGEALRMGEETAMHALKALRVIVPFVGMLFVIHLAEHDWHRLGEEWRARRALSLLFFSLAVLGDIADILCHVCVISSGILHVDHEALHVIEYYGMASAIVACLSVVAAEITSARAMRRALKAQATPSLHVVPLAVSEENA